MWENDTYLAALKGKWNSSAKKMNTREKTPLRKRSKWIISRNLLLFFVPYTSHISMLRTRFKKHVQKSEQDKKITACWHEETNAAGTSSGGINTKNHTCRTVEFTGPYCEWALTFFLESNCFFSFSLSLCFKAKWGAPGIENAACPAGQGGCWGQSSRLKCVPWMNLPLLLLSTFGWNTFWTVSRLQRGYLLKLGQLLAFSSFFFFFLSEDNDGIKQKNMSWPERTPHPQVPQK